MLTESYAKGIDTPGVRDITLGDLLKEAAETCPDRVGLIAGVPDPAARRQFTYAELYAEAEAAARAILTKFQPGDRISVMAPNIPEWIILEFGSALAGTILVTVNPSFQPEEIEYVLKQSRSAGIFVMKEHRGNPMQANVEKVAGNCPELHEVISFADWESFVAPGRASDAPLPDVKPMDPVMIQYTSGTTGFPKGALLHHRGLVNNADHTMAQNQIREGATVVTVMPLFHTAGCVLGVLGAVSRKATQALVEMFEPGLVLELSEEYKSETLFGVPTMLIAMLQHPTFKQRDLSNVKTLCSGGSTVPAELVRRLESELNAKFSIVFGQTECSPVATMTLPDDSADDKANTLGRAMPNTEAKIIDPETGATCPVGALGEFCTRGYHVMHGYYEMEDATAATIDEDGWLHTGDLCSMDERGYFKIEGRLKDMIIRGGENIYPREIEELLFKHPDVGEVAVLGLPDDRFGEIVAAFLRPAPGNDSVDQKSLFAYLREHLSPQKTPTKWFQVDTFPLTGSGKIQKVKIREQWEAGEHSELEP